MIEPGLEIGTQAVKPRPQTGLRREGENKMDALTPRRLITAACVYHVSTEAEGV